MQHFEHYLPSHIIFGLGSVETLPRELKKAQVGKPLLVTDPGILKTGVIDKIRDSITGQGIPLALFSDVEPNPSVSVVEKGTMLYRREGCDSVVVIGGGSSIDTAKAIGIVIANGGSITEYEGVDKVKNRIPWTVAIPTTYGSGSEATSFAVITDPGRKFKFAIGSPQILPHLAIIDPELMLTLPREVAASVGLDALCHAVESYASKLATPFSEMFAREAISIISKNIEGALLGERKVEAISAMAIGSTLAGMAFSLSRLGLIHAMSHPLSAIYGIPHGVANTLLFPHVLEYNVCANPAKYYLISKAMGIEACSQEEAIRKAIERIASLRDSFGLPAKLSSLGVKKEDIPRMAEDTMKSGNVKVNPREPTREDVILLYEKAF